MSVENKVADHYTQGGLAEAIFAGLRAAGKDPDNLSISDLAPVEEFHMGGREATVGFADRLGVVPGMHLLDVGCGIGGTARYFADARGCRVTGIDLTEEFCQVASLLADRVGLSGQVDYRQASALDLPFESGAFDGAYSIHVAMNIEDKAALYAEVARVVKPGGPFGVYDMMRDAGGEPRYPTSWSSDGSTSFLVTPEDARALLTDAGFEVLEMRDLTAFAIEFAERVRGKAAQGRPPPLGIHILQGADFQAKTVNVKRNMDEGRIAPTEIICRRQRGGT